MNIYRFKYLTRILKLRKILLKNMDRSSLSFVQMMNYNTKESRTNIHYKN